jgi:thioredoxin-dependent peroxiredoxin
MKQAPDFTLPDQDGNPRSLQDYKGKWVVLYFYPKDETDGCIAEACSFRDGHEALLASKAVVLGVSKDSIESHNKFTDHYRLPFILLSDPDGLAIKPYGAWTPLFAKRMTFIIDPEGNIAREYPKVTPAEHATQILRDLKELQATQ